MSHAVYRWSDDLFCSGCIVGAMLEHEPWDELNLDVYEGQHEEALDEIAEHFNFSRSEPPDNFPQRVVDIPQFICSQCLQWFR